VLELILDVRLEHDEVREIEGKDDMEEVVVYEDDVVVADDEEMEDEDDKAEVKLEDLLRISLVPAATLAPAAVGAAAVLSKVVLSPITVAVLLPGSLLLCLSIIFPCPLTSGAIPGRT